MGHQLHCNLCGSTFGTRKNVWEEHIRTAKHLRLLRSKTAGDRRVTQTSLEQFAGTDAAAARQRGKIEMEHRVRVVRADTSSNMALSAINGDMKELVEEKRDFRLGVGDASNLARQTLPRITADLDTEDKVAVEAGGGFFSFFFDGFSEGDEHSLVVFQQSSASAERGFAMLRAAIGLQQQKSLEDLEAVRLRQRFSIKHVSAGVE